MPVVTCPKCPTKLRVADTATGNVKCPKCGTMFPVAQTPPKPQPKPAFEVVDDAPPPPKAPAAPKSAAGPRATPPAPAPAAPGAAGNPFSFDGADSKPRKKKSVFDDAGDDEPAPARDEDEPPPRKKARADEDEPPRARKASDGGKGSKWGGTDDEDDDDRPRKKRRRDDDDEDDEDDRPRSKKRRYADDDDDEDARPRSKKRRRSDDDDDDRPRGKKRRYADEADDEDDEDWHSSPKKKKKGAAGFGNAKIGVLLLNISFWLYGVSLALIAFFIFLAWTGAFDRSMSSGGTTTVRRTNNRGGFTEETTASNNTAELVVKLPGLIGIGNWVVAGVGFGFCIAGPQRSRGMAIASASLAAGHLVLAGISINNLNGLTGGLGAGGGTMILWATTLPILDTLLPILIMDGTRIIGTDYVFALLAAGCELARLICAMLMLEAIAAAVKDHDSQEKARFGLMGAAGVVGASAILALLVALLFKAEAIKSIGTLMNVTFGTMLLIYIGFTAMTIMPIWATHGLRGELARKSR